MRYFVYILGTGSHWRNNEIRYSLRSIERFFPDSKIFIIGELPEWITNVVHIPFTDQHKNKQENAREKYRVAATDNRISDEFILMNDDFFFLKKMKIENFSLGTMEAMIKKHPTKGGYYYQSMIDTKKLLEELGIKEPLSFEAHAPIVFRKRLLLRTLETVGTKTPYAIRSCYGNLNHLKEKNVTDFKANTLAEFAWQLAKQRPILSISDNLVIHKEFRDWLRGRFKKPSQYETDRGDGTEAVPGNPVSHMRYYAKETFTYRGKTYSLGEIIDDEYMDDLRYNKNMASLWEQK